MRCMYHGTSSLEIIQNAVVSILANRNHDNLLILGEGCFSLDHESGLQVVGFVEKGMCKIRVRARLQRLDVGACC